MISLAVLAVVFVLTAVRQIGRGRLQIWQIMLFGAITVLITGQISLSDALKTIDVDVMLFSFVCLPSALPLKKAVISPIYVTNYLKEQKTLNNCFST
ncbi:hypothetical protein [Thermosulfidibacter takaii]|uniref:hypothetical protein n=1 Tax=Thermosulfidibacter takaii TaxID=412593 RepID=UPI0018D28715|nr:hypothetical protein [Thermosulfidibacter takaii]